MVRSECGRATFHLANVSFPLCSSGKPTEPSSVIDLDESDNDSGAASKPGKPSEPLERQPIKPKLVVLCACGYVCTHVLVRS